MELIEYPDAEMMMMDLADQLASELRRCLSDHDHASFVVPGGSTPGPIFDTLSGAKLDWDRVHVMLSDERWVPETSERSNTRLVKERLLVGPAAAARFIPFYTGDPTPEDGLDDVIRGLEGEFPISVLLLGMGADMHTASLFPGADRLEEAMSRDAPPLMAMRAPGAPEPRVTLTRPYLDGAMSKHIVITGAEKREAIERARHLDVLEAPIKGVWSEAKIHWAES